MRLYVETNFILELLYGQEQHAAADELVRLVEGGTASLRLPAFCVAESMYAVNGRVARRQQLWDAVQKEADQIGRSAAHQSTTAGLAVIVGQLAGVNNGEQERLVDVWSRLLPACSVLSVDATVLSEARSHRSQLDLDPPDAVVFASITTDLARHPLAGEFGLFLSRDKRAFDVGVAKQILRLHGCEYVNGFTPGLNRILAALADAARPANA